MSAFNDNHLHRRSQHMSLQKKRADCKTGGFYVSPAAGSTVDSLQPLEIKWDNSCLQDTDKVDIYLYAPKTSNPIVHKYEGVDYASGSYSAEIKPKWWNAASNVELNLKIVKSNTPAFMNNLPAGPVFTATYAAPDSGTPESADITVADANKITVAGAAANNGSLSQGKIAAATIMPLLFFIALGVLLFIKFKRSRQAQKTETFHEKVDRRMSVVSGDWKSMTPSGAREAVRASTYQPSEGARMSSYSFGNQSGDNRSSTFATEGAPNNAGRGIYSQENSSVGNFDYVNGNAGKTHTPRQRSNANNVMRPSFTQSRVSFADSVNAPPSHLRQPRTNSYAEANRQSRVSFADGTRPSVDSRRSQYTTNSGMERGSRAFHSSFSVAPDAPPIPSRRLSNDEALMMSPSQKNGPFQLTPDSISREMSRDDDDIGAAISYMQSPTSADVLFSVPPTPGPDSASSTMPIPPSPAFSAGTPVSPGGFFANQQDVKSKETDGRVAVSPLGPMPMGATAVGFTSPDDMLRAYAMRQSATPMTRHHSGSNGSRSSWNDKDAYGAI